MNWRRLRSGMGSSPEPAVQAYPRLRMPRKRPQVLGIDRNCSESKGWAACPLDMYLYTRLGLSSRPADWPVSHCRHPNLVRATPPLRQDVIFRNDSRLEAENASLHTLLVAVDCGHASSLLCPTGVRGKSAGITTALRSSQMASCMRSASVWGSSAPSQLS